MLDLIVGIFKFALYLLHIMYNMEDIRINKPPRLDRIVTVRISGSDYENLLTISEKKDSNISKIIRNVMDLVISIAGDNDSVFR